MVQCSVSAPTMQALLLLALVAVHDNASLPSARAELRCRPGGERGGEAGPWLDHLAQHPCSPITDPHLAIGWCFEKILWGPVCCGPKNGQVEQ